MQAHPMYDTTVKINFTHSISSSVMTEIRLDQTMTVWQIKLQVEKRYGSDPALISLSLKDRQGNTLHLLTNDGALFETYGPQDGYTIHVLDKNPNSILKGLEDVSKVKKFTLTEDEYKKVPGTFRQFKAGMKKNPVVVDDSQKPSFDDEIEKDLADLISVGSRCELLQSKQRGTIRYVGQVPQMGLGYFVGVQLDEPFGTNNGQIKGYSYFACPPNYGLFLRPSEVAVGDFPELDLDDEI